MESRIVEKNGGILAISDWDYYFTYWTELLDLKELCPYSIFLSWRNLVLPALEEEQELFLQSWGNSNLSPFLHLQYVDYGHILISTFGSFLIYTWLVLGSIYACDNSLEPASQTVKSATYWMLQLFSVLSMCLIVSFPLFQVTWRLFKWEYLLSNLHESSIIVALSKVIFFSMEVPETPKNLRNYLWKTYFFILREEEIQRLCFTYAGLQADNTVLLLYFPG